MADGPDKNWYFVGGVSAEPATLGTLLTRAFEPGDSFRAAQHGDRSLPSRDAGPWPHCRQVDLEDLHRQLWEGEGCVGAQADSRTQRIRRVLAESIDVNSSWEKLVLPLDMDAKENPFVALIFKKLRELEGSVLESPAAQPPAVHLACRLRYP